PPNVAPEGAKPEEPGAPAPGWRASGLGESLCALCLGLAPQAIRASRLRGVKAEMSRASRLLLRNLPFPVILAVRSLRSTRRDAFASFLSAVAACGLALGVAALILSLAVISGFQSALRAELLGRTPQIEVELPRGADAAAAREAVRGVAG